MGDTIDRVMDATLKYIAHRGQPDPDFVLSPSSAICQDAAIFGIDVDDYVNELEDTFGPVIRQIPWLRYTDQTASFRGCGCLAFPFWLMARIIIWPFRKGKIIPRANPREFGPRLELQHIAKVIDAGHWLEP